MAMLSESSDKSLTVQSSNKSAPLMKKSIHLKEAAKDKATMHSQPQVEKQRYQRFQLGSMNQMKIVRGNQLNKKSSKKRESNSFISDSPKQSRNISLDFIEERKEFRLSSHAKSSSSDLISHSTQREPEQ